MFERIALAAILSIFSIGTQAASFIPLSDISGGGFSSRAYGISADGSTVVGQGTGSSGAEAFQWVSGSGIGGLGYLPSGNPESAALATSNDGSAVVGYGTRGGPSTYAEAYRWTAPGGMVGLGDLPGAGTYSAAWGISGDGSVVVGESSTPLGGAFRWTSSGGMVNLGDLPGAPVGTSSGSAARGVSADGSVVVGYGYNRTTDGFGHHGNEAFRWTSDGGMVGLGFLPGSTYNSEARGVSSDGAVVVGLSFVGAGGVEAFRWTSDGGMVGLGDLPGGSFESIGYATSADGGVVVGSGQSGLGAEAFVWTQASGMSRLLDVLVTNGATGLVGWSLTQAIDVSADGQWITGTGFNPLGQTEAFLANITPVPIPPAVWLFGGALGLLGVARRRSAA